jgi:Ni2+-binding GTPase involved in maturation of urease and hydrogenase
MILKPLKLGNGGPVGSGKTALVEWLFRSSFVFANLREGRGIDQIVKWINRELLFEN